MKNNTKILNSYVIGATASVIFIVFLTIATDLVPELKNWLKETFYHHWIGKGVLAILVLFVFKNLLFLFDKSKESAKSIVENIWLLIYVSIFGSILITLFYIFETYFLH